MWISLGEQTLIRQAAWTQGPKGQSNCAQISVDLYSYMCFLNSKTIKAETAVDFLMWICGYLKINTLKISKEPDAKHSGFVDSYNLVKALIAPKDVYLWIFGNMKPKPKMS